MMRRIAYVLMTVAALAGPAAASPGKGITTQATQVFGTTPDTRFGGPGGVSVLATNGPNDVSVHIDAGSGRYIVHDPAGAEAGNSYCIAVSPTFVSCQVLGGRVFTDLRAGNDSLTVGPEVAGPVQGRGGPGADRVALGRAYAGAVSFRGGEGPDILAGGIRVDKLIGQEGNDRLKGRGGGDTLKGEEGTDRAGGGPGDDRLVMDDNHRDRAIDCGSGRDEAFIDPEDPAPRGCERIKAR
jgi:Ca2+-binding RTX toxin-like protein